ncbi:MAG: cytosine deaminase [Alphaproteobacteria bacterium]|nr:MAG: cytosine deaminase [Alphaproteobacteria bacterium]
MSVTTTLPVWTEVPDRPHQWLAGVRVPACVLSGPAPAPLDREGLVALDLEVRDGRIAAIAPAGTAPSSATWLGGAVTLPGAVDAHTHLDKGFTWGRAPNPDGSFAGALATIRADYRHWTEEDVRRRMAHGLALAYAHGTVAIRTHLDSGEEVRDTTWAAFEAARADWAGRITLQAASIIWLDAFTRAEGRVLADRVAAAGGVLGFVIQHDGGAETPLPEWIADAIATAVRLAGERGLDLDLHLDETGATGSTCLAAVAEAVARAQDQGLFRGRVQVGHCCALAQQDDATVAATIAAVRDTGIAVVSLPMCNLYLQDRAQRPGADRGDAIVTPRWRGITLLHELAAAGVPVSLASDNCRDAFYAYGQLDLLEVLREGTRIGHLDHPFGAWPASISATPAQVLGVEAGRIAVGAAADLVVLNARSLNRALADPHHDRVVLRAGRPLPRTLPRDPDAAG